MSLLAKLKKTEATTNETEQHKRVRSYPCGENTSQDTFHFGTRDAQTQCSLIDCMIDLKVATYMAIPKDAECLAPVL